ncbi:MULTISPECIES: hypothetical protein [Aerococcus]|uniref:hypothetical protein n=1 Tax=Aerococcus TaxID=1375 RepID=UPI0018A6F0BC|nr:MULTISPECIES: hypothetical protein [Aerococcus]MCY3067631.1 hypothetical protein [Aerococcus mictus]MCY3080467.1 hypothetical protein [Aerococcus mictus]MDK8484530.1 hypothetical protein [Aerococcus urinae]
MTQITIDWKEICREDEYIPPWYEYRGTLISHIEFGNNNKVDFYYDTRYENAMYYSFSPWIPDPEEVGYFTCYVYDEDSFDITTRGFYIDEEEDWVKMLSWKG